MVTQPRLVGEIPCSIQGYATKNNKKVWVERRGETCRKGITLRIGISIPSYLMVYKAHTISTGNR